MIAIVLMIVVGLSGQVGSVYVTSEDAGCRLELVETIPVEMNLTSSHMTTFSAWQKLIEIANDDLLITSMYWTMRSIDVVNRSEPTAKLGETIFAGLQDLVKRGVTLRIINDKPAREKGSNTYRRTLPADLQILSDIGATVELLDMRNFTSGVLHAKLWLSDRRHFYIGSANMDWRSLTQVKEMGLLGINCPVIVADLGRTFDLLWWASTLDRPPTAIPKQFNAVYNSTNPIKLATSQRFTDATQLVYTSFTPPPLCPAYRESGLNTILRLINQAKKFVYIAVMDYFPSSLYRPRGETTFWPKIDDALRQAALERGVNVRLMASHWNHTRPALASYLRSLTAFYPDRIQTRFFRVPDVPGQLPIPYSRVNHNKYMVTDAGFWLGTNNWSWDYFANTVGTGFVWHLSNSGQLVRLCEPTRDKYSYCPLNTARGQQLLGVDLQTTFQRDWSSEFSTAVDCR